MPMHRIQRASSAWRRSMQTQRFDKARATLQQVNRLPDEALVLAGGVSYTSHNIAKAMLNRLP